MKNFNLVKITLKSIIPIKKIKYLTLAIFLLAFFNILHAIEMDLNGENILLYILNGNLTYSIKGKFLYIIVQLTPIVILGNYLYLFIKQQLMYYIIRIDTIKKWCKSFFLSIFIFVFLYYLFFILMLMLSLFLINKDIMIEMIMNSENKKYIIQIITINMLNNILYIVLNSIFLIIIKKEIFSYLIISILALININIFILNNNVSKLLPTAQALIPCTVNDVNYNIIYLLISLIVLCAFFKIYISKNIFCILNKREE